MITEYTRTESREATFYMEVLINTVFMILNSPVKKTVFTASHEWMEHVINLSSLEILGD